MNDTAKNLIQSVVGDVRWTSTDSGFCSCPGSELHSNGSNNQDALVRLDAEGVPYIFCFHATCRQKQNEANAELRALFSSHGLVEKKPKTEDKRAAELKAKELRRVKWLARHRVLPVLIQNPVPVDAWTSESPYPVADLSPVQQTHAFLSGNFRPFDNVWSGERYETGEDYAWNFRTVTEWLAVRSYGQQVSRSVFKREVCHRDSENVLFHRLTVLESDTLSREQFGAVIRYAQKYAILRSIVDTGGKGIHCAFDSFYDLDLYAILEGLACDRNVLRYSLTTRLAGAMRKNADGSPTGKIQRLLYLNPSYEVTI